jgi:hypothetical protein
MAETTQAATPRRRRVAWIAGSAAVWVCASWLLAWYIVIPAASVVYVETVGSHARLRALWGPLMRDPLVGELPFSALGMMVMVGLIVWALVRFAHTPPVIWVGVAVGVGCLLLLQLVGWVYVVSLIGPWLARGDVESLGLSAFMGAFSIGGAWLGQWLACRPRRLRHLSSSGSAEPLPAVAPSAPAPEPPQSLSNEPFDLD